MREEHRERSDQVWAGRAEESDEHLVANEIGRVVRVRAVRRCVEHENSGPDVVRLTAAPSYLKPDGDDVEVQKKMDSDGGMQHVWVTTRKRPCCAMRRTSL